MAYAPEAAHRSLVAAAGGASPVGAHLLQMVCKELKQRMGQQMQRPQRGLGGSCWGTAAADAAAAAGAEATAAAGAEATAAAAAAHVLLI